MFKQIYHVSKFCFHVFPGNLYLEKVTAEDAGTYVCKAGNGVNGLMWDAVKVMMLDIIGEYSRFCKGQGHLVQGCLAYVN